MTQEQRRLYLIQELLKERPDGAGIEIPTEQEGQKRLLRSLFNLRQPQPASQEFLAVQDAYLQEETRRKGVTSLAQLRPVEKGLYLWQGDITTLACGATVNAANSQLLGCFYPCHGCIDNAIHTYAGVQLRLECAQLMARQGHPEPTGQAKVTQAYNLPCQYVLHTVGPIITGRVTPRDEAAAGRLLPRLPGGRPGAGHPQRGLLLHLHRGISLSQPAGGGNRPEDGAGLPKRDIQPN